MLVSRNPSFEPESVSNLVFNGRFLTRPTTGVERTAFHLARAIADLAGPQDEQVLEMRVPTGHDLSTVRANWVVRTVGRLQGHLWEQLELPRKLGRRWLLSACNTGPITTRNHIALIHDAQIYQTPDAYSFAFRSWYRFLLPVLGRRARMVATVSDYSRRMLEQYGVVPAGKAVVIPNGCDHMGDIRADDMVLARHGLKDEPYLLAIGSLSPHKNIDVLLKAWARLGEAAPRLAIAGAGNSRIFSAAGFSNLPGVCFLGRVSDAELRALYSGARALLFPSFFEGFGLPPLEAMYCGCPVIASTGGAIPEVCGDAALYADPHDVDAWVSQISAICEDEGLATDLRAKGLDRAAMFTWEKSAAMLIAHWNALQ